MPAQAEKEHKKPSPSSGSIETGFRELTRRLLAQAREQDQQGNQELADIRRSQAAKLGIFLGAVQEELASLGVKDIPLSELAREKPTVSQKESKTSSKPLRGRPKKIKEAERPKSKEAPVQASQKVKLVLSDGELQVLVEEKEARISPREKEVLRLLMGSPGLTNRELAGRIKITSLNVTFLIGSIKRKLGQDFVLGTEEGKGKWRHLRHRLNQGKTEIVNKKSEQTTTVIYTAPQVEDKKEEPKNVEDDTPNGEVNETEAVAGENIDEVKMRILRFLYNTDGWVDFGQAVAGVFGKGRYQEEQVFLNVIKFLMSEGRVQRMETEEGTSLFRLTEEGEIYLNEHDVQQHLEAELPQAMKTNGVGKVALPQKAEQRSVDEPLDNAGLYVLLGLILDAKEVSLINSGQVRDELRFMRERLAKNPKIIQQVEKEKEQLLVWLKEVLLTFVKNPQSVIAQQEREGVRYLLQTCQGMTRDTIDKLFPQQKKKSPWS